MKRASAPDPSPPPKISIDLVYEALCKTCDALEELGCKYFLAGGTMLGAVREGDLISHDIDFDLDCLIEDEQTILNGAEVFLEKGLKIEKQLSMSPREFTTSAPTKTPMYISCIHVQYNDVRVGDIYVFTIFDDGIARRFDQATGVYANSKMTIPGWYYSGDEYLSIRGRKFRSVRSPEVVLEKIYGNNWRITHTPGQAQPGRNDSSGAVQDADIEKLILHAIKQGWEPCADNAPKWPQPVQWAGWAGPKSVARDWIFRHDPMVRPEMAAIVQDPDFLLLFEGADVRMRSTLLKITAAKAIQVEHDRIKIEVAEWKAKNDELKAQISRLKTPFPILVLRALRARWYRLLGRK